MCSGDDLRNRVNVNMARRMSRGPQQTQTQTQTQTQIQYQYSLALTDFLFRFVNKLVHDANFTPEEKDLDADTCHEVGLNICKEVSDGQ